MRNKIIAVNAVIVLIVGLLAFAIVRTQLAAETSSTDQLKRSAQRDVAGAAAQLQLDALRAERWLAMKANEPATRAALTKATPDARGDAARQLCDQIASAASRSVPTRSMPQALASAWILSALRPIRMGSGITRSPLASATPPCLRMAMIDRIKC